MLMSYLVPVFVVAIGATVGLGLNWLDRMVAYHKKKFLDDLAQLPPLTVTVEKAPVGFVDSPKWDQESVLRLVMLIEVLDVRPAKQAIRRALSSTRRFYLPAGKNTFDLFPSWGRDHPNNIYYDDLPQYDDPLTNAPQDEVTTDDTVVYISNPVEAHLPSSMITVRLLREIMEDRAKGLRIMPPSTRATYSWKTKTSSKAKRGSTKPEVSSAVSEVDATTPPANNTVDVNGTELNTGNNTVGVNGAELNTGNNTVGVNGTELNTGNNTVGVNDTEIIQTNNTAPNNDPN